MWQRRIRKNLVPFYKVKLLLKENLIKMAHSSGAIEYTDCISAEGIRPPPPMSVLYMTLNNLIVRFQS